MKNLIRASKYLQIMVLLAFFLPFFPAGCEPKKAETAPLSDSILLADTVSLKDSVADITMHLPEDTTINDSASIKTSSTPIQQSDNNDNSLSSKLSARFSILKPLLRPSDNFTGIGYSVDIFEYFQGLGVGFALILFLLSLIIKFKDYNSIFHLINWLAVITLFFSNEINPFASQTKLWGYWICLGLGVILILFDAFIFIKQRKSQNQNPDFSI